jgi:probable DNA metabolism protein
MFTYVYDGTFEGLLTVIFEAYDRKQWPDDIESVQNYIKPLWDNSFEVITDETRANRVWTGIRKKLPSENCSMLYKAFLSNEKNIELSIFKYVRKLFTLKESQETDFNDDDTLSIFKLAQKVNRECQRMLMFLRFQRTADGIYVAVFDPMYDVIPLQINHFTARFADQPWIIFDTRRNYGFYFDKQEVTRITFEEDESPFDSSGKISVDVLDKDEILFQQLWKKYFDSICIKERKNLKLHKQMLPKRFWKYMPEKAS